MHTRPPAVLVGRVARLCFPACSLRKRIPSARVSPRQAGAAPNPTKRVAKLLDLDFGAGVFELLLDRGGLVFVDAFLDGLGGAVHQVLGFFQAQAGDLANRLDDVDLVRPDLGEHDGKLRLVLRRRRRSDSAPRRSSGNHCGCRGDAEGLFHLLHQVGGLEKRQTLDPFQDRFYLICHCRFLSSQSANLKSYGVASGPVAIASGLPPPELNLLALTASLTVTARLRGNAASAAAMRCAGACSKNMILPMSSSFEGSCESCWICSIERTRPSTIPARNLNAGTSLAIFVSALASATGSLQV